MNTIPKQAKWIGLTDCPLDTTPVFRKSLSIKCCKRAELCISGVGFYVLYCNGKLVSDELLNPAFSRYDKTVYYNVHSLEKYLNKGENCLEIVLGNGWYNQMQPDGWEFEHAAWKGIPRLICAMYIGYECVMTSDSSWQAAVGATTFNSLRCGETYDSRIVIDEWKQATVLPGTGGILKRQSIEPIRLKQVLEPVATVPSDEPIIFDFGKNISGNVEICVKGERGSKVRIQYAENVLPNGFLSLERNREHVHYPRFQMDEYILSGNGEETWHSHFGYNGFRYAQVVVPKECELLRINARQFHTDLREKGRIITSDASITRIQNAIIQSSLTNFHHMPTDCPHREKNGWTGDAWLSCVQMLHNHDVRNAYEKWLDDIVDCQRPNGQIPGIAPTSSWGYNWGSGVTWDAALIVIPWEMYRFYGDVSVLMRYSEPIYKYLIYLESVLENGIPSIGLGDWCAPPEAEVISDELLRCFIAVYVAKISEQIGIRICNKQLIVQGELIEKACSDAIQRELNNSKNSNNSQLLYSLLLLLSLGKDSNKIKESLINSVNEHNGHLMGGIFSARFVPEALVCSGCKDLAWKMISAKGYPGWDDLSQKCAGTLGEHWNGGSSMNHHMFSSVGTLYYTLLAGITLLEPGFSKIKLEPYIPKEITDFSASVETPYGKLVVMWNNSRLSIEMPNGINAVLYMGGHEIALSAGVSSFDLM